MTFVIPETGDTALAQQFVDWVATATWKDSREYLTAHAGTLLTAPAEAALQQLIDENPDHQVLALHQWILAGARAEGVEAAYDALEESLHFRALTETLVAWVTTQSWDEAHAFFEAHQDESLTDEAESVLAALATDNPEQPDLLAHQGLLALCRIDGSEKAYLLLSDIDRLRGLIASPAGQKYPVRALPRARLLAGLFPEDPEAVLALALAAMREGDREGMELAIGRCVAMTGPSLRREFARRLGELADTEPDLAPVLRVLEGVFRKSSEDTPS